MAYYKNANCYFKCWNILYPGAVQIQFYHEHLMTIQCVTVITREQFIEQWILIQKDLLWYDVHVCVTLDFLYLYDIQYNECLCRLTLFLLPWQPLPTKAYRFLHQFAVSPWQPGLWTSQFNLWQLHDLPLTENKHSLSPEYFLSLHVIVHRNSRNMVGKMQIIHWLCS